MKLLASLILAMPLAALAGAQQYEALADGVRANMSRLVSSRAPAKMHFRSVTDAHRWLSAMDKRLEARIPDRNDRQQLLRIVQYEATRARLDPQLVLGIIEVESRFRRYAVSRAGARGYMQVMPFWPKLLGQPNANLFDVQTNISYGCVILRHYLDMEKGDYRRALGRYNGSLRDTGYPEQVLAAWQGRWKYDGPKA